MYLFLVKFLFRVLFCSRIAKRNDTKRKNIIGQVSIFTHYLHTVFIRIGRCPYSTQSQTFSSQQNILLAAESLGLGAVWTAAYPYEDRMQVVRKYTNLPDNILPLCVIPFGYPATKENPKQKFDEKKIHYNQY